MSKFALGLLAIAFAGSVLAQQSESDRKSNQPVKPFRVIGNIYYVGANEVTSYLITGSTGHIDGKTYEVVFLGGVTIPGYKLVENVSYPSIADDYVRSFALLKRLPCDVFLGAHGSYFGLETRMPRIGETPNPFIDPEGYRRHLEGLERAFHDQLDREKREATGR